MWIRFLACDEGDSQIRKNLFLRRRQEVADNESQGLDRQSFGRVELNGARGSEDLSKISDRHFCSCTDCSIPHLRRADPVGESISSGEKPKPKLSTLLRERCRPLRKNEFEQSWEGSSVALWSDRIHHMPQRLLSADGDC